MENEDINNQISNSIQKAELDSINQEPKKDRHPENGEDYEKMDFFHKVWYWRWWLLIILIIILVIFTFFYQKLFIGNLNVKGDYTSASISINDKNYDKLPVQAKLAKGSYLVNIVKENYLPFSTVVDIKAGKQTDVSPKLYKIRLVNNIDGQSLESPKLSLNKNYIQFYDRVNKNFARVPVYLTSGQIPSQNIEEISSRLGFIEDKEAPQISWSNDLSKALIHANPFRIYDLIGKRTTTLEKNIVAAALQGNDKLIKVFKAGNQYFVYSMSILNNKKSLIVKLREKPQLVSAPENGEMLAVATANNIRLFNIKTKKEVEVINTPATSLKWLNSGALVYTEKDSIIYEKLMLYRLADKKVEEVDVIDRGSYIVGDSELIYTAIGDSNAILKKYSPSEGKTSISHSEYADRPNLIDFKDGRLYFISPLQENQILSIDLNNPEQ